MNKFAAGLALCRPALTSHQNLTEYSILLQELLKSDGSTIHKARRPSPYTLPVKYLDAYISHLNDPGLKEILQMHRDDIPLFEEKLKHHTFIELCPLEKPEDIRAVTAFEQYASTLHAGDPPSRTVPCLPRIPDAYGGSGGLYRHPSGQNPRAAERADSGTAQLAAPFTPVVSYTTKTSNTPSWVYSRFLNLSLFLLFFALTICHYFFCADIVLQ